MSDKELAESLDVEWVQLIKQALEAGIEKEEISRFLKEKSVVIEKP